MYRACLSVAGTILALLLLTAPASADPFDIAGPTGAVIDPVVGELFTVDLVTSQPGVITDLNVSIEIAPTNCCFPDDHPWDDFVFSISHDGVTVILHDNPTAHGPSLNVIFDVTFDDEASVTLDDLIAGAAPPPLPDAIGDFRPDAGSLSDFDGMDIAGTWTVGFFEICCANESILQSWSISGEGGDPVVFLIADEDTIDNGIKTIESISFGPPGCGGGDPAICVNDDIADPGVRSQLFTGVVDITPFAGLVLPTGTIGDEGLFKLTNSDPQMSLKGTPDFTTIELLSAAGPAADENNLDEILGVEGLSAADIESLEGRTVCALVYDSDVSTSDDGFASLKGATQGLTEFTVMEVSPNPLGGSHLPLITVDLLPSSDLLQVFGVASGFGTGEQGSGGTAPGTGPGNFSQFHSIDPDTGVATEISMNIGFGGDNSALAINKDGVVFSARGGRGPNDLGRGESLSRLLTIEPFSGAGGAIGPMGIEFGPPQSAGLGPGAGDFDQFGSLRQNVSDMSFHPDGTLYGMAARGSQLFTVDTGTGLATRIGTPCPTDASGNATSCRRGNAIAFDADGTLFWANDVEIAELNPSTGLIFGDAIPLDFTPFGPPDEPDAEFRVVGMAFHPLTGELYASVLQRQFQDSPPARATLAILDPLTGTFDIIGAVDGTGVKLEGIAFKLDAISNLCKLAMPATF